MSTLVLTAGKGTRLRPYTEIVPKPALRFINSPLFKLAISQFFSIEDEFIFNLHYLPKKMQAIIESHMTSKKIAFSDEKNRILGSGGAIWKAQNYLVDDFFVINGDEIFLTKSNAWINELKKNNPYLASLVVTDHKDLLTDFKAIWIDKNGYVQGFGWDPPENRTDLIPKHFTGYQRFSNRIFDFLPKGESNIFYDVLVKAIASGEKIKALEVEGLWYETGNATSFILAMEQILRLCRDNNNDTLLAAFKPQLIRKEYNFKECKHTGKLQVINKNIIVPKQVTLKGFIYLEDNIDLSNAELIENSVVYSGGICEKRSNNQIWGITSES